MDIDVVVCGWCTFAGRFTEETHPYDFALLEGYGLQPLRVDTTFKVCVTLFIVLFVTITCRSKVNPKLHTRLEKRVSISC